MANRRKDIAGIRQGYLTAQRPTKARSRHGAVVWVVKCRCGTILRMVASDFLKKYKRKLNVPRSCGCYQRTHRSHLYKGVGDLSSTRWKNVQGHARRKWLDLKISIQYAWRLFLRQKKRCALSGTKLLLSPNSMAAGSSTASLDRIDSNKGYVPGNVQWVHIVINDLKSSMPEADFIDWCRRVTRWRT